MGHKTQNDFFIISYSKCLYLKFDDDDDDDDDDELFLRYG